MKELSEYTAEVMRRADDKKRAIKLARVGALSVCAPLVLAAVIILPLALRRSNADAAPGEADGPSAHVTPTEAACDNGSPETYTDGSLSMPVRFKVSKDNGSASVSDPDAAASLYELIMGIEACGDRSIDQGQNDGATLITFFFEDGCCEEYSLFQDLLVNEYEGICYSIDEETLAELNEMLNIG